MFHRLYQINKNFNLLMKLILKKRYYVMSQKRALKAWKEEFINQWQY